VRDDGEIRVGERPGRPLLVFDGDCGFCRQWVGRWRGITGERVEYRPSQEVAERFPEIGEARFKARVWLIEPDGRATSGAGAVFRLYALAGEMRWPIWMYQEIPTFAAVAEAAYAIVARHRGAAAVATRLLWGDVVERPRYRRMQAIFLRGLGFVYLVAFWSLAVQVDGLIGGRGVLPAAEFLRTIGPALGEQAHWQLPTLLWLDSSDRALHILTRGGVVVSGLVVAGVFPGPCLALLWTAYLSLMVVGQPFLGYQWDVLLLEAGGLGILFAPWNAWIGWARWEPSTVVLWLIRWLVFRVMFLSGVVKLTSGDPTWRAWEALKFHYETQPLPTWTSWSLHQAPGWFHAASVGIMFWAELIAPFLVFGPRRVRMVGFWSLVLLQLLIAATGNYGFFNLLSIVLCLTLVEDRDWGRRYADGDALPRRRWWHRAALASVGAIIVTVTTMESLDRAGSTVVYPAPLESVRRLVAPYHSMNAYGLFAVITTDRPEIIVEGSQDGNVWEPYTFAWKPGDPGRRPPFSTPHMPRLDWQMWFAALAGDCRTQSWFRAFERRLLEGSPEVLGLLREDPFPRKPPRYVRARLFLYRFTGRGAEAWWQREEVGMFCPPAAL